MALETASFIADLNALNPATTDTMAQGDDHLRLIKAVLKAQFPNWTSAALTSTQAQIDAVTALLSSNDFTIPAGSTAHDGGHLVLSGQGTDRKFRLQNSNGNIWVQSWNGTTWVNAFVIQQDGNVYVGASLTPISFLGEIRLWSGSTTSIPSGWHLCDGTNGTPDLRNRFVVGAGSTYAVGAVGGADSVALTVGQMPSHNHNYSDPGHAHIISIADPGHAHGVFDPVHNHQVHLGTGAGTGFGTIGSNNTTNQFTDVNTTGISIQASGTGITASSDNRFTGLVIQNAGSGQTHENRPPYFALAYIMRIA